MTDIDAIQLLIREWADALRAKDVDGRVASYAPDVVLFDVVGPLRHGGLVALRQRLSRWFSTFAGPIEPDVRDLDITVGGDAAFCHSLWRFAGRLRDGGQLDMRVRFTTCLRRLDGRWTVTHEHASAPFDPETGRLSAASVGSSSG